MRKKRKSDESDNAVEGSEEYFDESEHVDGLAEEEVDETRENEREGCRSPEGSDFAAEESYEEGDPDAEEGYEEVWDEVQEALSTESARE